MPEKYEKPEVDFVEMEDEDVIVTSSNCPTWTYGNDCKGSLAV